MLSLKRCDEELSEYSFLLEMPQQYNHEEAELMNMKEEIFDDELFVNSVSIMDDLPDIPRELEQQWKEGIYSKEDEKTLRLVQIGLYNLERLCVKWSNKKCDIMLSAKNSDLPNCVVYLEEKYHDIVGFTVLNKKEESCEKMYNCGSKKANIIASNNSEKQMKELYKKYYLKNYDGYIDLEIENKPMITFSGWCKIKGKEYPNIKVIPKIRDSVYQERNVKTAIQFIQKNANLESNPWISKDGSVMICSPEMEFKHQTAKRQKTVKPLTTSMNDIIVLFERSKILKTVFFTITKVEKVEEEYCNFPIESPDDHDMVKKHYDGFINEKDKIMYFFGSIFPRGVLEYKKDSVGKENIYFFLK